MITPPLCHTVSAEYNRRFAETSRRVLAFDVLDVADGAGETIVVGRVINWLGLWSMRHFGSFGADARMRMMIRFSLSAALSNQDGASRG